MISLRSIVQTIQLTKCCEPLQELRTRLSVYKATLSPQVILYYRLSKGSTPTVLIFVLYLLIFVLFAAFI